jgi:hypothetical protein
VDQVAPALILEAFDLHSDGVGQLLGVASGQLLAQQLGGEAIKAAASEARRQMQQMFGCPVHLEVWVKVKASWRSDEAALASLGYGD